MLKFNQTKAKPATKIYRQATLNPKINLELSLLALSLAKNHAEEAKSSVLYLSSIFTRLSHSLPRLKPPKIDSNIKAYWRSFGDGGMASLVVDLRLFTAEWLYERRNSNRRQTMPAFEINLLLTYLYRYSPLQFNFYTFINPIIGMNFHVIICSCSQVTKKPCQYTKVAG